MDIVIRYIEVDLTFGLPYYVRYIEEFVISRFVISKNSLYRGSLYLGSIHTFYCNFGRDIDIVRYIEDFVK